MIVIVFWNTELLLRIDFLDYGINTRPAGVASRTRIAEEGE